MPATADDFLKINYAMMRPKTMTAGGVEQRESCARAKCASGSWRAC